MGYRSHYIFLLALTFFSDSVFAAEGESVQQYVLRFEKVISQPGEPLEKLIVETYNIETAAQLRTAETKITAEVKAALSTNAGLEVEFVHANYSEASLPKVAPVNKAASEAIEQARAAWGVSQAFVETSSSSVDRNQIGFSELIATDRVVATQVTLPPLINEADKYNAAEESPSLEPTIETKGGRRTNLILTVVRSVSALGINGYMIYSALGGDIFSPMVVPAMLFYPGLELVLQRLNVRYENLLKSIPGVYGRLAFRTGVSFACLLTHVGLLSSIGLADFSLFAITVTAAKVATFTHSWWEMALSPKSELIRGRYVSFSLGILGMAGLLMETVGINFGSYILYGLGASGAVLWSRFGALEDLRRDAIKAKDFFKSKLTHLSRYFGSSCESVQRNLFKEFLGRK